MPRGSHEDASASDASARYGLGMDDETYPALRAMQEQKVRRGVAWVIRWMMIAPRTYRRREVADEIEGILKEVDRMLGGLPDSLPRRRRTLLLTPRKPVPLNLEVYRYVTGVVRGSAIGDVQQLVTQTCSAELVRRFLRYGGGNDRPALKRELAVLEVMTA